jgi:hypothetical protein
MKKTHTFLMLFLISNFKMFSQAEFKKDEKSQKITFTKIIELDSNYTSEKIFNLSKQYLSTSLSELNRSNSDKNFSTNDLLLGTQRGNSANIDQMHRVNEPLKYSDKSENKLIGKCVVKYSGNSAGCLRIIYTEGDVDISIKKNRVKISITNLNYTHYNQMSMKQAQIYGWNDEGPCASKNKLEEILNCDRCKNELSRYSEFANEQFNSIINSYETFIRESKITTDEW